MAWQTLPVQVAPVLPGTLPVLRWFAAGARALRATTHAGLMRRYTAPMDWLDEVKWDAQGLVPVIAQEVGSNDVLMFAFMNREALARTAEPARRCTGAARASACGTRARSPATSSRCTRCAWTATTTWCC